MKISFDGLIMMIQPDAVNWEPPRLIARDGDYAPVRGQFFSCRLSFGKMAVPSLDDWWDVYDTLSHIVILPRPGRLAQMTSYNCYVDDISIRYDVSDTVDHCAVIAGFDVTLSGILVT